MPANINYEYYEGKDHYNDGDIEQILLERFKENCNYTQKEYEGLGYFYLLTPIRKNIINWYDFKEDANILEIGPGAGTITDVLCQKAKHVTVVEASKRRAEIVYERHKNQDNLDIIVGNFNDIKFDKKFDYVVLIGVLEYAMQFCKGNNPFVSFLNSIKDCLVDDGRMLLAIENRNGLKYWAGANEDHLSLPYVGILGYKDTKVKTFGKKEMERLLMQSGFTNYKFYYPLPDYKLPRVIYTDKYLPKEYYATKELIFNHDSAGYTFNPKKALINVIENENFDFFANSFFIEAGINGKEFDYNTIYAKMTPTRNDEYSVITKIKNNNTVEKYPFNKNEKKHLNKLVETHKKLKELNIDCSDVKVEDDIYKIEYIEGTVVTEQIYKLYRQKNKEAIVDLIERYMNWIDDKVSTDDIIEKEFISDEISQIYNENVKILKMGLIDLNMSNVIYNNGEFVLIDQEWVTDKKIPLEYVKYFSIKLIYEEIEELQELIDKEELYKKYNIDSNMREIFDRASNKYFFDENNTMHIDTYKILDNQTFLAYREDMLNSKIKERDENIQSLNNDINNLQESIKKRDEKIDNLDSNLKELEDELIKNNIKLTDSSNQIDKQKNEINTLNRQIEKLEKENRKLIQESDTKKGISLKNIFKRK